MANMAPVTTTIDNVVYSFQLLEADIPVLTLMKPADPSSGVPGGATLDAYAALCEAIGLKNWAGTPRVDTTVSPQDGSFRFQSNARIPGLLQPLIPGGKMGDWGFVMPTGKSLLSAAAIYLGNPAGVGFPREAVLAILALSLKGGGMTMAAAGAAADRISRSVQTSGGKAYVPYVLCPQILNAAAAA